MRERVFSCWGWIGIEALRWAGEWCFKGISEKQRWKPLLEKGPRLQNKSGPRPTGYILRCIRSTISDLIPLFEAQLIQTLPGCELISSAW